MRHKVNKKFSRYLNIKIIFGIDGGEITEINEDCEFTGLAKEINIKMPKEIEVDDLIVWDKDDIGLYATFHGVDTNYEDLGDAQLSYVNVYFNLKHGTIIEVDTESMDA